MKRLDASQCKVHVLVCTNERPPGKSCCKLVGGQGFFEKLKIKLKETGYHGEIRATRTGCLGYCNNVGATVTIHVAGKPAEWFSEVTDLDFDTIWEKLLSYRTD